MACCCCCKRSFIENTDDSGKRPWPPDGPGKRCICQMYPNLVDRKIKFCQPPPPKPYSTKFYKSPKTHVSHDTVYKMSYLPVEAGSIASVKIREDVGVPRKMETNTTQRMSYLPNKGIRPRSPCRPCKRNILGEGPAQSITTHRHDYVPQPSTGEPPFSVKYYSKPPTHLSNSTTNRHDFTWPEHFAPCQTAKKPPDAPSKAHISEKTIHRLSFSPLTTFARSIPKQRVDIRSRSKISANTVYNMSYGPGLECGEEEMKNNLCPGGCQCPYPGKCFYVPNGGQYSVCCCHCPKAAIE